MKKNGIDDVKKSKYFTLWDIVPYLCVLAVAVALLLVFLLPEKSEMTGFYVMHDDRTVMDFSFDSDSFNISEEYKDGVKIEEKNGGYSVSVVTADGYNVFFVDKKERTVKMVDADCSYTQDCTYMPEIKSTGDSIICVPHKLKIVASGGIDSPVTG